jgi:hypothetical protein
MPRRAAARAKNASKNMRYVPKDTVKGIPRSLSAENIAGCSIEFIDLGPYDVFLDTEDKVRTNHTILRLTFQHEIEKATPYAPKKTEGFILDLTLNGYQGDVTAEGELMVTTFPYSSPHKKSFTSVDLFVNSGKNVRDVLRVIQNVCLIPCGFSFIHKPA